jgi:hypothetical protein
MNRPKDARLLTALAVAALALGACAAWSLVDWSRDMASAAQPSGETGESAE